MRKKQEASDGLQVIEPVLSSKAYRKRWAALIKKIWNIDPLIVSKVRRKNGYCVLYRRPGGDKEVLTHLDLWTVPERPLPKPLL
ncbi:MAG: hypothetical protein AB9903_27555 [Vulcanimicrobiota bacterium]